MIALNELIDNLDYFKKTYKSLNFKADLNKIVELEEKRKQFQLKFEGLRAECNKRCSELAERKNKGLSCKEELKKIVSIDKQISVLNKKLILQTKQIDKMLKNLRNLPDEIVLENKDIICSQKLVKINDFINKFCKDKENITKTDKTMSLAIKSISKRLFYETDLPEILDCKDGIICLFTDFDLQNNFNWILEILKENSKELVRIKSSKTEFSSTDEYRASFADGLIVLELKKEFFTREFGIKYKNSKIDMTKFVNQINLKIIKKWDQVVSFYFLSLKVSLWTAVLIELISDSDFSYGWALCFFVELSFLVICSDLIILCLKFFIFSSDSFNLDVVISDFCSLICGFASILACVGSKLSLELLGIDLSSDFVWYEASEFNLSSFGCDFVEFADFGL